jgi:phytanoyl-CoA hydroxylase
MTATAAEQQAFAQDGYFVRPDAVDPATIDALNLRLSQLISRCAAEHRSGQRRSLEFWDILRASQSDASVCWDLADGMPDNCHEWESRAMRVGHGLHLVDDTFAALTHSPAIGGVLASLVPAAVLLQSAVVYKQPRSSTVQFGLHQDAAYLTNDPESLILAFLALDDMDADNGALQVVPGTHRDPLHHSLAMSPGGFVSIAGQAPPERHYKPRLLPMRRGTAAFLHGRTLHASGPNHSPNPRRALIVHAMSGRSRLAPHCWIQPPPEGFVPL